MREMGLSQSMARAFLDMAQAIGAGKITTTMGNPENPTFPTRFDKFAEETFAPAYRLYEHEHRKAA
jgi:hypothetical protein